jgi:hypothetical protein
MAVGLRPTEANDILDAFMAEYQWIQLHDGDPGAAGTANVASTVARKDADAQGGAASAGSWTNGSGSINWTDSEVFADTFSNFSLWSTSTGSVLSNFGGSGTITANATLLCGDSFSILTSGLTIQLTVAA